MFIRTSDEGICKVCGNETRFENLNKGYRKYCSNQCSVSDVNILDRVKIKYGVDNISSLDSIKQKKKDTLIKNYGVDSPLKNKDILQKLQTTNLERYGNKVTVHSDSIKSKVVTDNNKKYGVDHSFQREDVKDKIKQTNLERYGVEYCLNSKQVRDDIKNKNLIKYGFESHLSSPDIRDKIKQTNMDRYGVDDVLKRDDVKRKIKETNLCKYGSESPLGNRDIRDKINHTLKIKYDVVNVSQIESLKDVIKTGIKNTRMLKRLEFYRNSFPDKLFLYEDSQHQHFRCTKCTKEFKATKQLIYFRDKYKEELCTNCNPFYSTSRCENELVEFIRTVYHGNIIPNDRTILNGQELDILLPELKIAFEYNGLYWHNELHTESTTHLYKTEECLKKGIKLIHIYEDDWLYKQDIVKSRILNLLGVNNKIMARKCLIKDVSNSDAVRFLDDNHIQGSCNSGIRYGLYYNNELVSLMTFGKSRFEDGKVELLRFCNKLNTTVIGGASKLFRYYIKNNQFNEVISYADRSWSNGELYGTIGFKLVGKTSPNYFYVINKKRENRFKYRKSELIKQGYSKYRTEHEIMLDRKIYRIYNSGSLKYIYYK